MTIISAVVVGLIIGALGRLVLPGRQDIGLVWTILIGIVASLIGSAVGASLHLSTLPVLLVQVVLAAVGVSAISAGRGARR